MSPTVQILPPDPKLPRDVQKVEFYNRESGITVTVFKHGGDFWIVDTLDPWGVLNKHIAYRGDMAGAESYIKKRFEIRSKS